MVAEGWTVGNAAVGAGLGIGVLSVAAASADDDSARETTKILM